MSRRIFISLVSLLACAATLPAQTAPNYQFVLADEYVRNFFGTTRLAPVSGVSGGVLTTPNSLAGADVRQSFVNIAGAYGFEWDDWQIGAVQPLIRAGLGGMFYDETLPVPASGFAGDTTDGFSVAANVQVGVRWRPWRHTTLGVNLWYGYMYAKNNYTANNPASRAVAGVADGSSRNWFANVFNSTTELTAAQSIPLWAGAWEDSEDAPTLPRLRLATSFANTANIGFYGTRNDQQRYVSSYFWTNGVELFLPAGKIGDSQLFVEPFIRRTDMFDDGHNAISSKEYFYEAGARIGLRNATGCGGWGGNDAVVLSGSAFWGGGCDGWQVAVQFRF